MSVRWWLVEIFLSIVVLFSSLCSSLSSTLLLIFHLYSFLLFFFGYFLFLMLFIAHLFLSHHTLFFDFSFPSSSFSFPNFFLLFSLRTMIFDISSFSSFPVWLLFVSNALHRPPFLSHHTLFFDFSFSSFLFFLSELLTLVLLDLCRLPYPPTFFLSFNISSFPLFLP